MNFTNEGVVLLRTDPDVVPLILKPVFDNPSVGPGRHALDSDDMSERGMLRDMQYRREYDLAEMRRKAKETK